MNKSRSGDSSGRTSRDKALELQQKKKKFYARSPHDPPAQLLQPLLWQALQYLHEIDAEQQVFHLPVSAEIAPNYTEYIPWPMDLSTMSTQLSSGM